MKIKRFMNNKNSLFELEAEQFLIDNLDARNNEEGP
jgi:hypothetical protein